MISDVVRVLGQRFIAAVPILLVVSMLLFAVLRMIPVDPLALSVPPNATNEEIDKIRHDMGFDRPIAVQYAVWLRNTVHFDFGRSIQHRESVSGLIAETLGHDRIAQFGGIGRVLPITMFTFGLAGLSLMGVPPSGGFVAKVLLLRAAVMEGQLWWAAVMLVGGLLAGGYVFMVLGKAFSGAGASFEIRAPVSRSREVVPLALALCAVLLGFVPLQPSNLLQIGRSQALTVTSP